MVVGRGNSANDYALKQNKETAAKCNDLSLRSPRLDYLGNIISPRVDDHLFTSSAVEMSNGLHCNKYQYLTLVTDSDAA